MLDQPLVTDGEAPTVAEDGTIAVRIEQCRNAYLEQGADARRAGLQVFELGRLRQSLGLRWPALRDRIVRVVQGTITRGMGPHDLCLVGSEDRIYLLRLGHERSEMARYGELVAAEATARLCGTIPGGAGIRVHTYPFDLDRGLAGVTSAAALCARMERGTHVPEPGGTAAIEHRLQPRFRPLLNPRKRLVSAYQLAGFAPGGAHTLAPFEPVHRSEIDDVSLAELDRWSLKQTLPALMPASGRMTVGLMVQVHYTTLAVMRWREGYVRFCRQLPNDSCRRLVFEVLGLPGWLPQTRVRELMAYLRPFCAAIVVRLRAVPTTIEHLVATGVRGLSSTGAPAVIDPNAFAASLRNFGDLARAHSMRTLVEELGSPGHARAAMAAGIDYISGDALIPPLLRPERPLLLPIQP